MLKLPDGLLETATVLADADPRLGEAALRRAVSTAYYALFAKLSGLCAGRIARARPTADSFKAIYRSLDHSQVRNALANHAEFAVMIGEAFKKLQEARHWADYSSETHPDSAKASGRERFTRSDASRLVALARRALEAVDALSPDAKQRLAVVMVVRTRR